MNGDTHPPRFWALLWSGTVVLLTVLLRSGEVRFPIPFFQYVFFGLTLLALLEFRTLNSASAVRALARRYVPLIVLMLIFLASAMDGLDPLFGMRLLAILILTSLAFLLIGDRLGWGGVTDLFRPIWIVSFTFAVMAATLDYVGPVTIGGLTFENYYQFDGQGKDWRWAFFLNEAPGMGYLMALGITTGLHCALATSNSRERLFLALFCVPLMLYALFMTNTRAAIAWAGFATVAYGVLIFVRGWQLGWSKKWLVGPVIITVITCVGLAIWHWEAIAMYLRIDASRTNYLPGGADSFRFSIWSIYWERFLERPLLGFGFGATDQLAVNLPGAGPANAYIGILGESGLPALLILLWIAGVSLWRAIRTGWGAWRDHHLLSLQAYSVAILLTGLGLQQLGEWSLFHVAPLHYLFILIIGLTRSPRNLR